MAELDEEFRLEDAPVDDRSFEPLPAGPYRLQVVESDIQLTKKGKEQHASGEALAKCDQQIVLTLEVIDGPYANRKLWDRINYRNQNPEAQRIAQITVGHLLMATGLKSLKDTTELHFRPFSARVSIRKDKTGQYPPQNAVRYLAGETVRAPMARHPQSSEPARPTKAAPADGAANNQRKVDQPTASHATPRSSAGGARPWMARQGDGS